MPFPLLAHQAIVLPLKLRWPRAFSGTALCIGSLAPDLEYLVRDHGPGLAHTARGQLVYCLPVTLVTTWLALRFAVPALVARAPLSALRHVSDAPRTLRAWATVAGSALVGSTSHVILDGLTHDGGWGTRLLPVLRRTVVVGGSSIVIVRLLQYVLTLLLAVAALWLLVRIARASAERDATPRPVSVASRVGTITLLAGAAAGGGAALRIARTVLADPTLYFMHPSLHAWGYAAFSTFVGAALGLFVASTVVGALDARHARTGAFPMRKRSDT